MGVAPEHEDEAIAIVERHVALFAVAGETGAGVYEYPLAFMVYEARSS
jgi:hypothetical protein